ncbi:MAG: hypothetical protein GQ565_00045 [Candidatus Aegiribacteria sp.]|nr:hypothetical protein [Candidatus Aegiribacteria sp.]
MTGGTVTRNFIDRKLTHSHSRELPCLFLCGSLGYVHLVPDEKELSMRNLGRNDNIRFEVMLRTGRDAISDEQVEQEVEKEK